jgi:MFS family permease
MHHADLPPPAPTDAAQGPWYRSLTRYHWFVLVVAALGWLFDTMDQQLFNIARVPAMRELLQSADGKPAELSLVREYAGYATAIFLIGWGTGGIAFGILGDLLGRARTMLLTILIYSLFTGLSALSMGFWDFAVYRFLTGLGVGGEFAVGVALVAEVMPDRARPFALGLLQALSAVGNITAALISLGLTFLAWDPVAGEPTFSTWRVMFAVGTLPALLAVVIRRKLKEPERWQAATAQASFASRIKAYGTELFSNPRWTRHALFGLLLASAGIIGLWGIGFFSIDLQRYIFRTRYEAANLIPGGPKLSPGEITFWVDVWASMTSITINFGAFFGIYLFGVVSHYAGRRPTFAVALILALLSTAFVFWRFDSVGDIFWMIPIMGFCQLSLFGGYAIYFPELFPTRLRSTGISFCYNVGRFVAATGPTALGLLSSRVYVGYPEPLPMRYAGITMCAIFLLGLAVLPFIPETKGKPLPE